MCRSPSTVRALTRAGSLGAVFLRLWPFPQTRGRAPLPPALVDDRTHPMRTGSEPLRASGD